jgi:protein-S-isoprenylcysteine O-methyltransferase Ste14
VAELLIMLGLLLFSAGTMAYWEAWACMMIYLVGGALVMVYLWAYDIALLERRLRKKEKDAKQSLIRKIGRLVTFPLYIVPGLDHRFGWSHVPTVVVVVADVVILLAHAWVFLVFRTNSYASRVIEVDAGQRLISTGPYAIVRHPMYLGLVVANLSIPLALGSWWAVLTVPPLIGILVARALNEERMLLKELAGYREYTQITRHRLIPYVW